MSAMAFAFLWKKCRKVIQSNDSMLTANAEKMVRKLEEHKELVCSDHSALAQIEDPRFANDYCVDAAFFRRFVVITKDVGRAEQNVSKIVSENCLFCELLGSKDNWDGALLNKVNRFLRATSSPDRMADPLSWRKRNAARFPAVAEVAKDVLEIQASSVTSESTSTIAGKLIEPRRSVL